MRPTPIRDTLFLCLPPHPRELYATIMRVKTLEIRWHDSKPINSCDFQPVPFKKARPAHEKDFTSQSYRLATGGEDNNVRVSATYILELIAVDKRLCLCRYGWYTRTLCLRAWQWVYRVQHPRLPRRIPPESNTLLHFRNTRPQ